MLEWRWKNTEKLGRNSTKMCFWNFNYEIWNKQRVLFCCQPVDNLLLAYVDSPNYQSIDSPEKPTPPFSWLTVYKFPPTDSSILSLCWQWTIVILLTVNHCHSVDNQLLSFCWQWTIVNLLTVNCCHSSDSQLLSFCWQWTIVILLTVNYCHSFGKFYYQCKNSSLLSITRYFLNVIWRTVDGPLIS